MSELPVSTTRMFVLDPFLRQVPAGQAGELFMGGTGVARGYAGRPALTAARFIADPFAADGSRLYRTGDRARWRDDGQLEFLGWADDQLEIRGYRVEPADVEAALAEHPGIGAVAVAVRAVGPQRRLVAYLVPADSGPGIPPAHELRVFLRDRLQDFMVPSVFTEVAELPLNPGGGLDRAALPAPDDGQGGRAGMLTPDEELLAAIWAQTLGVDKVGALDNFLELGGHSLLAVQVVSGIREVFGVEIPLAAVFNQPTVRELAPVIESSAPGVALPPVTAIGRDERLQLSFAQQRLWFLDQLEPGSAEYNAAMPVRLTGRLDAGALWRALGAITSRHEVLRTRLVAGPDGVASQVIVAPGDFPLAVADLSDGEDPSAVTAALLAADAVAPFDLAAGPLIRACLIRLAADDHVLALSVHHVASDEWSGRILRHELADLYTAFAAREPDPLPPLEVQYADFAAWQRRWLTEDAVAGQLAYWRGQLAGAPMLELPADRPRPPVRSTAGAYTGFGIAAQTAGRLRAMAREAGATTFMVLFAVCAVLLGRYSGLDDVVVGIPVANRNRPETENLIGFFVNTLVMRADLSGDPSFGELLARVRETALAAYAHQDLPFEQLVDALMTGRDRSRTPLFHVFFSYVAEDSPRPGLAAQGGAGLTLKAIRGGPVAKFDLRLILEEDDGGLTGGIEYSTALYDPATADRMARHLAAVLEVAAAGPGQRLSELTMITAAERDQLVCGWNATAAPVPAVGGVHELVAAVAAGRPDAVAVVFAGRSLSYAALRLRAARLARQLRDLDVRAETVVGLCLERGLDLMVAMLAVWQAGGAYLPLDPGYPAERLDFMLADSGTRVLLARRGRSGGLAGHLPASVQAAIWLDDPAVRAALAGAPDSPGPAVQAAAVSPDQLAYVIYTSGSTGRPKGVLSGHRGLVNRLAWMQDVYRLDPGERVLHKTPITFDVSLWELLWPLSTGGTLVIAEPGRHGDVGYLARLIEGQGVSVTHFVPSLFHQFVRSDWGAPLRDLRLVGCSGEALAGEDVTRFYARHATAEVVNLFGPTEAAIEVSYWPCERPGGPVVPIGRPIANTRLHVLDRQLRPVPTGIEGELVIGGVGLARGYLGRPGLTAERFVADPVAGDGSRLYRTGDRARRRADGALEFLGRVDDQLKVRGFRVEPGEVEAVLGGHPGVGAVVVVGVPVAGAGGVGSGDRRRLVAYVVGAGGGGVPPAGELRGFLRGRLPEFMVPGVFVELAGLPLTVNGKLDRAALPGVDGVRGGSGSVFVAPRSEAERVLAGVWAQVLGVERVGVEDNFFELGGDSIISVQVVARARAAGVVVSAAQLFEHQTVAALAGVASGGSVVVAEQGVVAGEFGLSPIQRWFFGRGLPVPGHFNQSVLAEVAGRVDAGVLRVAVAGVVAHHDGLRSRFGVRDGVWAGWVVAEEPADLVRVVDAGGAGAAGEAALLEAEGQRAQEGLDLGAGPLVRVVLFERGAAGQLLLVVAHHLVVDTVSWRIVLEDLSAAYGQAERGEAVRLAAKTTSFAQWSRRLGVLAGSGELAGEAGYWERVAGAGGALPRDLGGANVVASARQVRVVVGAGQTSRLLREVPGVYGTQVNDVLLTVLGVVLTGFARAGSVVVDLEGHGREEAVAGPGPGVDLSRTVGWFTSMFPVVLSGAPGGDLGAALRAAKEYLRGVPRRGVGYGVARFLAGAGGADAAVSFNYMGQFDKVAGRAGQRFRLTGRQLGAARSAGGQRSHLIEINAQVGADGCLAMVWTYSDQVHHEATVSALASRYVQVLDELIEHCGQPGAGGYTPSDFPLAGLDQAALDTLTARFGSTGPATPAPGTGGRP